MTKRKKQRSSRRVARALWFGLVPAGFGLVAGAYLVPVPFEGGGSFDALRDLVNDNPVAVGAAVFVLTTAAVSYWRHVLPGGRHLESKGRQGLGLRALVLLAFAAALALVLRSQVLGFYRVLSSSMQPSLSSGDTLAVNRLAYRTGGAPRRGDVIVFGKDATAPDGELIKRVIGVPGDRIDVRGGNLVINGWDVPNCDVGVYSFVSADAQTSARLFVEFLGDSAYLTLLGAFPGDVPTHFEVDAGELFVLGDNRTSSIDSRSWAVGNVAISSVRGRADRLISVAPRADKSSFRHWLEPVGTELHVDDADTSALQAGIDRCLKQRPANTHPPSPPLNRQARR